jgi:hypothetical protein
MIDAELGTDRHGDRGRQHPPGARVTLLDTAGKAVAAADTDEAGRYAIEGLADEDAPSPLLSDR